MYMRTLACRVCEMARIVCGCLIGRVRGNYSRGTTEGVQDDVYWVGVGDF